MTVFIFPGKISGEKVSLSGELLCPDTLAELESILGRNHFCVFNLWHICTFRVIVLCMCVCVCVSVCLSACLSTNVAYEHQHLQCYITMAIFQKLLHSGVIV